MIYKILCDKGDAPFDYDVDVAEVKFDELKNSGYLPMKVDGKKHVPMKAFDPDAEEVVWVPAIVGG